LHIRQLPPTAFFALPVDGEGFQLLDGFTYAVFVSMPQIHRTIGENLHPNLLFVHIQPKRHVTLIITVESFNILRRLKLPMRPLVVQVVNNICRLNGHRFTTEKWVPTRGDRYEIDTLGEIKIV